MELVIDPDVKAVAEFMQRNISGYRLCRVASAIAALAPLLWGVHGEQEQVEPLRPLRLDLEDPTGPFMHLECDAPKQSSAT